LYYGLPEILFIFGSLYPVILCTLQDVSFGSLADTFSIMRYYDKLVKVQLTNSEL